MGCPGPGSLDGGKVPPKPAQLGLRQGRMSHLPENLSIESLLCCGKHPQNAPQSHPAAMPPHPAQRPRLDPATPLSWSTDGRLVIGFADQPTSMAVIVADQAREVAVWVSLLDGSRTEADLIASAQAMGLSGGYASRLLAELLAAGQASEVETGPVLQGSETLLRDLRQASTYTGAALEGLVGRRASTEVLVHGAGALPSLVVDLLAKQLLRVTWEPTHKSRIRAQDLVDGADPALIGKTWLALRRPAARPQLVVAIAEAHDPEELSERFARTPVLLVTCHRHRVSIGPTLNLGGTACGRCLNRQRAAADSDWPFSLTQLLHSPRPISSPGQPWLGLAANQLATLVIDAVDRGAVGFIANHSWELAPPDPIWRWRSWPSAADCDCRSAAERGPADGEELSGEGNRPRASGSEQGDDVRL